MSALVDLFRGRCADTDTLEELRRLLGDRTHWKRGHALFDRIRRKHLAAIRTEDRVQEAQYRFEEMCAKTLYNLSGQPAPFDADSPYWVVPDALTLARMVGLSDQDVLKVVVPDPLDR